jgi:hypothetical protein
LHFAVSEEYYAYIFVRFLVPIEMLFLPLNTGLQLELPMVAHQAVSGLLRKVSTSGYAPRPGVRYQTIAVHQYSVRIISKVETPCSLRTIRHERQGGILMLSLTLFFLKMALFC